MLVFLSQALEPLNSKTPGSESISVHIPIAFTTVVGVPNPLPRWESALTEPFEAFALFAGGPFRRSTGFRKRNRDSLLMSKGLSKPCAL